MFWVFLNVECIPAARRMLLLPLKTAWKGLIKMFWCGSRRIWRRGFVFMVQRPGPNLEFRNVHKQASFIPASSASAPSIEMFALSLAGTEGEAVHGHFLHPRNDSVGCSKWLFHHQWHRIRPRSSVQGRLGERASDSHNNKCDTSLLRLWKLDLWVEQKQ